MRKPGFEQIKKTLGSIQVFRSTEPKYNQSRIKKPSATKTGMYTITGTQGFN